MSDPKTTSGAAPYRRTKVFISYRRSGNAGDAERLYDELRRYLPARHLFLDVKSIRRGDLWPLAVETALDSSRVFLAIIGPQWLGSSDEQGRRRLEDPSDTLRREVSAALARGAWLIPVLLHGASMPEAEELPDDLKRLAECQAVEIRSGHWGNDVRELVAILKRRLYRRRRLTIVASLVAALVVVVLLACRFATVALPIELRADDKLATLLVEYHASKEEAQTADEQGAAEGAKDEVTAQTANDGEAPQEIVVKGLSVDGGYLLKHDGSLLSDAQVEADSGQFDAGTVGRQVLDAKWAEKLGTVLYMGAGTEGASDKSPPEPDFDLTCSTSVAVRAANAGAPTTLRFFQKNEPAPTDSREILLSADGQLNVDMDVTKLTSKKGYGLGCSKKFQFDDDPPKPSNVGETEATIVANAGASLTFTFMPIVGDKNKTPPELNFLRLKATDHIEPFDLDVTRLSARCVAVRARGSEENPCDDKLGRDSTVSFKAISADDKRPLRLRRLVLGAADFSLTVEGKAYVWSGGKSESPDIAERARLNKGWALLLLITAAGILIGLVYSVARL